MISGVIQGIQTWNSSRDRKAAIKAQKEAFDKTMESKDITIRAVGLMRIVPRGTLARLKRKLQRCYGKFDEILDNEEDYFPQDVSDAAAVALPKCVCDTLKLIIDVNGSLADEELKGAWKSYGYNERIKPQVDGDSSR